MLSHANSKNEFEWCKKSVVTCVEVGVRLIIKKKKQHTRYKIYKISDADQNAYKRRAIDKHFFNQIGK